MTTTVTDGVAHIETVQSVTEDTSILVSGCFEDLHDLSGVVLELLDKDDDRPCLDTFAHQDFIRLSDLSHVAERNQSIVAVPCAVSVEGCEDGMAGTTGAHCFIHSTVTNFGRDNELRVIAQGVFCQVKHADLNRRICCEHRHYTCRTVILHIVLNGIEFLGILNSQNTVVVVLVVRNVLVDAKVLQRRFAGAGASGNSD